MADYAQAAEFLAEGVVGFLVANAIDNVNDDYNDLAVSYFNLYQTQRNFYFNNFQVSGEAPFATEQFGIVFYSPDYVGNYHNGYLPPGVWLFFRPEMANRLANMGSTTIAGYWQRFGQRYTPGGATLQQEISGTYAMEVANIFDDWDSYQNRYEEHKRDVLNERRWASRMGSLSYGVKEAYTVERGLATSFEVYDDAQGQLISADSTLLNGLATFAGYRQMQKAVREGFDTEIDNQNSPFLTNVFPRNN